MSPSTTKAESTCVIVRAVAAHAQSLTHFFLGILPTNIQHQYNTVTSSSQHNRPQELCPDTSISSCSVFRFPVQGRLISLSSSHSSSAGVLLSSMASYISPGPLCDMCRFCSIQERPDYHSRQFKAISISPVTGIVFKAYEYSAIQLADAFDKIISSYIDFEIKKQALAR